MAVTIEQLKAMIAAEGVAAFEGTGPFGGPALLVPLEGLFGTYQVVISLDQHGQLLQLRTLDYLHCAPDEPHREVVFGALLDLNARFRGVKFGWNAADGEIMAYADVWVMDGVVTRAQLRRLLQNYFPLIDQAYSRLGGCLDRGEDPGDPDPLQELRKTFEGSPPAVRDAMEARFAELRVPFESDIEEGSDSTPPSERG